jgi:hypothetical protein
VVWEDGGGNSASYPILIHPGAHPIALLGYNESGTVCGPSEGEPLPIHFQVSLISLVPK